MSMFRECDGGIEWRSADQFVRVEVWGEDSVRVRSGVGPLLEDQPGALLDLPALSSKPIVELPLAGSASSVAEAAIGMTSGVKGPPAVLQHGLLRGSFVPATPQRQLRELTRQRKQLIQAKSSVANRIQKVLEDANIKLGSVASDVLGVSGRLMLEAIIAGEDNPEVLAELARRKRRIRLYKRDTQRV